MRNYFKNLLQIVVALSLITSLSSCSYNSIVKKEEEVSKTWGDVETAYQRRMDLIPNIVKTVQATANFEKSTLVAVMDARASATKVTMNIDPNKLTETNVAAFQSAQNNLSSTLSRLMVVQENYPQLKSNESFMALQAELEGTENRIAVARRNFNAAVNDYNSTIRSFPANTTASMFGFQKKGYFKSDPKAATVPDVKF
ncbi:MAG: LemA family protein [Bacteroidetes bacterium]|nr:LemA family protein [Bacteroidota bacterium]